MNTEKVVTISWAVAAHMMDAANIIAILHFILSVQQQNDGTDSDLH